ncbi:MAG: hypothetical protein WC689_01585 [Methylocystis sp.]
MRKAPDKVCAANNFDVAIASNKARIYDAAANLEARGANVVTMEADLSTIEGVDRFMTQLSNSAGPLTSSSRTRAMDWATPSAIKPLKKVRDVIDANITGTVYAIRKSPNSIAQRRPLQDREFRAFRGDHRVHSIGARLAFLSCAARITRPANP